MLLSFTLCALRSMTEFIVFIPNLFFLSSIPFLLLLLWRSAVCQSTQNRELNSQGKFTKMKEVEEKIENLRNEINYKVNIVSSVLIVLWKNSLSHRIFFQSLSMSWPLRTITIKVFFLKFHPSVSFRVCLLINFAHFTYPSHIDIRSEWRMHSTDSE